MSANGVRRVLVNDHAGHPFQVQLSRALAQRGYEVLHTYCGSDLTPRGCLERKHGDPSGFETRAIELEGGFEKYALIRRWQQERELGRRLAEIAKEFSPDLIISSNAPLGTQAFLQAEARRLGAGFVFWMQDALGVGYRNVLRRKLPLVGNVIGLAFMAFERWLLARSDEVIVITEDFVPYLPASVRSRQAVTVIENWAPLDELPAVVKNNDWSVRYGLSETTNFLYSGTLGLKHNPGLLRDLAKALSARDDARVVVISEGPGAQWLAARKRAECLDNLVLLPFQPFEQMPSVLASADVLLALLEASAGTFSVPSKVLTYLCARRPLLLAVPGENLSARIVSEITAGVTVLPDDAAGFVAAGLRMLEDSAKRNAYARNGRAYAERTFDISIIADRFEEIICRASRSERMTGTVRLSP